MSSQTHFEPSPIRLSTNLSIARQTPKADFGDRMQAGLATASSVIATGAGVVGTFIPAAAVLSAAMSSVAQFAGARGNTAYASTSTSAGGGAIGQMNADLAASQAANQRMLQAQSAGGTSSSVAGMNSDLVQSQADNAALLKVQIAMQHENQVFSAVSNVLKTRHDTVKNSIGNIR